jgi:isopenicillin N synthase-like dioxygenase
MDSFIKNITEKHYAPVAFPLSHEELNNAADTFLEFLTLPDVIKNSFSMKGGFEHNYGVIGYKDRRQEEGSDKKEFFHYHPSLDTYFESNPDKDMPEVEAFLKAARAIDAAAARVLKETLTMLEPEFPNIVSEYFPGTHRRTILRFLKYDVAGKGKHLAKGHYDSGGCTLALAESAPGLRIGTYEEDLQPVVHADKTALFMPGLRFYTQTDQRFHPAWHDVVQASEDTLNESTARWAIVFFADGESQKDRPTTEEIFTPKKFF